LALATLIPDEIGACDGELADEDGIDVVTLAVVVVFEAVVLAGMDPSAVGYTKFVSQ
jgi:hypothetical protein